jgi:hypothetical protein
MSEIALQRKISDTVAEYEEKHSNIVKALKTFEQAGKDLELACTIGGTYGRTRIDTGRVYDRDLFANLLKSAWLNVYGSLQLERIASADDKKKFEQSLEELPEFTMDNLKATFGKYILNPRENILRGMAEVFCSLDQSYKSHEKVKIGVKGLPQRS